MNANAPVRFILHVAAFVFLALLGWESFQPLPEHVAPTSEKSRSQNEPKPSTTPEIDTPHFAYLWATQFLVPGQTMGIQGLVRGINGPKRVHLSLSGPDGIVTNLELRAGTGGEAPFAIEHPTPAAATGLFTWELCLRPTGTPVLLGAQVRAPALPRVLILQDYPSVEGARLQGWIAASGTPVTTRTRVSAEHYRLSSTNGSLDELPQLAPARLERFDVVVAHESALARLESVERQALDQAIHDSGLGLLVIGSIHAGVTDSDLELLRVRPDPNAQGESRPAQLQFPGGPGASTSSNPMQNSVSDFEPFISVLAAEIEMRPGTHVLVRDTQGRAAACMVPSGHGRVTRSLLLDSWRWRQHGSAPTYARFWSVLLSATARPLPPTEGEWSLGSPSLPVFVDEPVLLSWHASEKAPLQQAEVHALADAAGSGVVLNVGREPTSARGARSHYWPVHPGWNEVRVRTDGPGLSFYVQPGDALPALRAERQREIVDRLRQSSEAGPTASSAEFDRAASPHFTPAIWFVLFLLSAMGLWMSDRARPW